MNETTPTGWLATIRDSLASYRRMIDAAVEQLTDSELFLRPAPDFNSVAVILRHLGGNLCSRWTDFLTTDGEKPDRDRDSEFVDWQGNRASLLQHFDDGWKAFELAFDALHESNIGQTVYIRGEPHSIQQALIRSLTHVAYHTGQVTLVARMVHVGDWRWLTIAPGVSSEFNKQVWGTSASRSILAESGNAERLDSVTDLPFNKHVGIRKATAEEDLLEIPSGAQFLNHIGTVHAGAQLSLAEACSGEFLLKHMGGGTDIVPVVRRVDAKFRKPANGRITATVCTPSDVVDDALRELAAKGRSLLTIHVELHDESGQHSLSAYFVWFLARSTTT